MGKVPKTVSSLWRFAVSRIESNSSGKIGVLGPGLETLPVFEFHEDAVESSHLALHFGCKYRL